MMKKFLGVIGMAMLMAACSAQGDTIQGKDYKMQNAMNDAEISLGFSAKSNRFFGGVVNRYFGTYKIDGNNIELSPAGSTMMMGPQPLMEAEQAYLSSLPQIKTFSLEGKKLILMFADCKEYIFDETGAVKE